LIFDHKLQLVDLDEYPIIDLTIDGADEVDENLVAIKGGGACLAQEKIIANAAKRFVIVADYRKDSKKLGQNWTKGIPFEVMPMACESVRHHLSTKLGTDIEKLVIRTGREKVGPVITDNGNFVIDWAFDPQHTRSESDWKSLSDQVKLIPGVVETGIFAGMIDAAYFGYSTEGVKIRKYK